MPEELLAQSNKDVRITNLENNVFHQRVIMVCLSGIIFLLCVVLGADKETSEISPMESKQFGVESNLTAPSINQNDPPIGAAIQTSLINGVLRDFSDVRQTIEPILNATDQLEYIADNWTKMLKDESALLVTIVVGVIYIGVIIFTGLVTIAYTCCCQSKKEKPDWDTRPVSYGWRTVTAFLAILISIGGVMCIFANNYAHESIGHVRTDLNQTMQYPGAYFTVLNTQLESYYTEYQEFEAISMNRLRDREIGDNIQQIVVGAFKPTQTKVDELLEEANDLIKALDGLKNDAGETKTSAETLEKALVAYKAKDCNCDQTGATGDALIQCKSNCQLISFGITTIDEAYKNMDEALKAINASPFLEINGDIGDEFDQIPQTINDMTTSLVDDLTEEGGSLEEVRSNLRTALDNINGQFDEISTTVDDLAKTLDTNMEAIENAEDFRKGIFLAIAALIIIIGLCGLFGILFPSSSCGLIMLRASIALSFLFSIIFMILVMVAFLTGAVSEKYFCQPFSYDSSSIPGVEFLEEIIPELQFDINGKEVRVSQLLYQCEQNQPITSAANLTDLITEFVDKDQIFEQVDNQMKVINTTYDDIVSNLGLEDHIQSLVDYKTPDELGESKAELDKGKKEVDAILASLDTIKNQNDPDQVDIKEKATILANSFQNLIDSAQKLVTDAEQMKPAEIAPHLEQFRVDLTGAKSPVKNAIYGEAKFLRENIFTFVSQITDHVQTKLGPCQPIYQTYDNLVTIICSYIVQSLNSLWFALGWPTAFIPFFIVTAFVVIMKR